MLTIVERHHVSFLLGIKGILITVYTYCLLEERPCADRGVYAAASHWLLRLIFLRGLI